MRLLIRTFRCMLPLVLSGLLVACGDASVQVAPMDDYERSTSSLVAELSSASGTQRTRILTSLTGARGYRLDWADFWARLQHSEAASDIWNDHKPELHVLALKSCRSDQYQALARFLISRNEGWTWLVGPEKVCNSALGPEIATWLVAYLADPPARVHGGDLTEFFVYELRSEPNPQKWLPYWNQPTEEQLVSSYQSLSDTDAMLKMRLRVAFRNVWDRDLHGAIPGVLERPFELAFRLQENDSVEALEYIVRIATNEEPPKPLTGMIAMQQLATAAFTQSATLEKHWSHYLLLRNLLSHCARTWSISERLRHRDRLMKEIVKQLHLARAQEVAAFFRSRLAEAWDPGTFMELATFAFTLEGAKSAFAAELEARASNQGQDSATADEYLIRLRFQIQWADAPNTRALLAKHFCDTLRSVGVPTGTLVSLSGLSSLDSNPGCFVVKTSENASLQTQQDIDLSYFSVVDFQTKELVINATSFYAGIIEVSDTARLKFRAKTIGEAVVVTEGSGTFSLKKDE